MHVVLWVSLLFIIFCTTELSHLHKLCHLGDTEAIWDGRQVGRKHSQLSRVPEASHPSSPQLSDGGLMLSSPSHTPHGTKTQENKSTKVQQECKMGSFKASTQKMEGCQEQWQMHIDGQKHLPSVRYIPAGKLPPKEVSETLFPPQI